MAIKKTTAHEIIDSQDNIWPPAMIQNGDWVYQEINDLPDEVKNEAKTLWTQSNINHFISVMEAGNEGTIIEE